MTPLVRYLALALIGLGLPLSSGVLLAAPAEAKVWSIPKIDPSSDPLVDGDEYADRVMAAINKIRVDKGKSKVKVFQGCLDHHSNKWARHLADIGKLLHRDQYAMLRACNLHWTGETLVSGTALLPDEAVHAWMHSAPHRAVIMKSRAKLAGVGVAVTKAGVVYCVLNFGDRT